MNSSELLDAFRGVRVLVVGDVMLDEYVFGRATRISPEAPVMVLRQERTTAVPGGAANVARNIAAFGAKAHLVGVVGEDSAAEQLRDGLAAESLTHGLVADATRVTSRKTRVIADGRHQLVRIDHETDIPVTGAAQDAILAEVRSRLMDADVVLLSDYTKGCLSAEVVRGILEVAKAAWKPVVVNAKPTSLPNYRGATVISLNRSEASAAVGEEVTPANAADWAQFLRDRHRADALLITLGDAGMEVAGPESFRISAPRVEVADPAGAGDTVIATIALGIAATGFAASVFELAAAAAARVVQHVGVVAPSESDLDAMRAQVS